VSIQILDLHFVRPAKGRRLLPDPGALAAVVLEERLNVGDADPDPRERSMIMNSIGPPFAGQRIAARPRARSARRRCCRDNEPDSNRKMLLALLRVDHRAASPECEFVQMRVFAARWEFAADTLRSVPSLRRMNTSPS
jgi:hypothetical protein